MKSTTLAARVLTDAELAAKIRVMAALIAEDQSTLHAYRQELKRRKRKPKP